MKIHRVIIPILISISLGYFFGKLMFNLYENRTLPVVQTNENVYFLQSGVYSSYDSMINNCAKQSNYVYLVEEGRYHVFVAITKNEKLLEKLKDFFIKKGNNIYVKEYGVSNMEFLELLNQYDKLLEYSNDDDSIRAITKQVLSNYEEVVGSEGDG